MNPELAKQLGASVADFYERYGAAFSRTRGMVWPEENYVAGLIKPDMTVADIGAGNGRFSRLVPAGAKYLGVEPSESLRSTVRPLLTKEGQGEVLPGGFPNLPLTDNLADVTTCFAVFHHLPSKEERQAAVQELIRITKPNGLIAATAWYLNTNDPRLSPVAGGDAGDFWMSWKAEGADAKRYVHVFSKDEWTALWNDPQLTVERIGLFDRESWTEDETAARNWMVIARKKSGVL